jgi:hypothetical protein
MKKWLIVRNKKRMLQKCILSFTYSVNIIFPIHRNYILVIYHRFYIFNIQLEYESDFNKEMKDTYSPTRILYKESLFYFSLPER